MDGEATKKSNAMTKKPLVLDNAATRDQYYAGVRRPLDYERRNSHNIVGGGNRAGESARFCIRTRMRCGVAIDTVVVIIDMHCMSRIKPRSTLTAQRTSDVARS